MKKLIKWFLIRELREARIRLAVAMETERALKEINTRHASTTDYFLGEEVKARREVARLQAIINDIGLKMED